MSQKSHPGTWASTSRIGGALAGEPTGHYYGTTTVMCIPVHSMVQRISLFSFDHVAIYRVMPTLCRQTKGMAGVAVWSSFDEACPAQVRSVYHCVAALPAGWNEYSPPAGGQK